MCGRYTLVMDLSSLLVRFSFEVPPGGNLDYQPGHNIAPTNNVLVVAERAWGRFASMMRWGLVPAWSQAPNPKIAPINAKAENVASSGMFKNALRRRRCLVLADGFYEWRKLTDRRPVRITLASKEPFAFAGLWERWQPKPGQQGEPIDSCTIITTTPNDLIAPIHDRMPVILPKEAESLWLDPHVEPEAALSLLKPYQAEAMQMYEVSPLVNSVRNNGPEVIEPVRRLIG
ncbi:MAG: SOS response-associated peptidase [Dehalococcoidia bacterium]|nr:SOS response-associated peptidase [Dehalococcoidia bacterium]